MKAKFLVGGQFVLLGLLFFVKGAPLLSANSIPSTISLFLYSVATLIMFFAFMALRPSLRVSPIPRSGAPLIDRGIYRWLRHPMYLAVLLFGAGMAIRDLSYLSIGFWTLLFIVLVIKAGYEDALLSDIHPEAKKYQTSTRGIVLTKKNEKRAR